MSVLFKLELNSPIVLLIRREKIADANSSIRTKLSGYTEWLETWIMAHFIHVRLLLDGTIFNFKRISFRDIYNTQKKMIDIILIQYENYIM